MIDFDNMFLLFDSQYHSSLVLLSLTEKESLRNGDHIVHHERRTVCWGVKLPDFMLVTK